MPGTRITAFGHFQPDRIVPNTEIEKLVDTSDEWITQRVGIRERRWAGPDESVADMAVRAAQDLLQRSGADPARIDMIVVATCTARDRSPNTAARVAVALGMEHTPVTMDVNTACSGFCHALAIAQHAIAAGAAEHALVIGAEKLTDFTDPTDRSTVVLTADGAGAVLLSAAETDGVSPVLWGAVPQLSDAVRIEYANGDKFAQNGNAVYRWTTRSLPEIAQQVIRKAGLEPSEIGAIVLHQANLRIIEPLAARIGCEGARVATDVTESGNTSAASVPLALSKLQASDDPLPSGTKALLFAFGGGLAYAGQVVTIP